MGLADWIEIGRMDELGRMDTPAHRLDARAKAVVTLAFIGVVMSFPRHEISALTPFLLYPVALIAAGPHPCAAHPEEDTGGGALCAGHRHLQSVHGPATGRHHRAVCRYRRLGLVRLDHVPFRPDGRGGVGAGRLHRDVPSWRRVGATRRPPRVCHATAVSLPVSVRRGGRGPQDDAGRGTAIRRDDVLCVFVCMAL